MGISCLGRSSDGNWSPPNPNPKNCRIRRLATSGYYTAAYIEYHGCTTFDGMKVLVFCLTQDEVLAKNEIDPHFYDSPDSPIARFPGNDDGWRDAIRYMEMKGTQ